MSTEKKSFNTPLLQFLAIGAVLFGLNYWFNGNVQSDSTIIIAKEELDSYAKMASNNGNIDSNIFNKLIEKRINQELVYQYGMSLNLTQSDSKIKEQIVSAAQNIIMAQAPIGDPGDSVLLDYLNSFNNSQLERETYDFEQYFYGSKLISAQQALFLINAGNLIQSEDSLNLPNKFSNLGRRKIEETFGVLLSDSLCAQKDGWRGIIKSNFGYHVIINYWKRTITMNLENSRNTIFEAWKKKEQKVFYAKFIRGLKDDANIELNVTDK